MKDLLKILTTKTAFGGLLAVGSWLVSQESIEPTTISAALGAMLTILGGRHAIEKSGPPQK